MTKSPFLGAEGLDSDLAHSGRYLASRPKAEQLAIARAWIESLDEPALLDEILDLVAQANRRDKYGRIRQTIREMLGMKENMTPLLVKITCHEIIRIRSRNSGADEKEGSDDQLWQEDDPEQPPGGLAMRGKFPFFGVGGMDPGLIDDGQTLASRPVKDQLVIARAWLNGIIDEPALLKSLLDLIGRAALRGEYARIREQIRQMLEHDFDRTPNKIAYEVRRRLKMSPTMRPLMISIARREKSRMRAEKRRALAKEKT